MQGSEKPALLSISVALLFRFPELLQEHYDLSVQGTAYAKSVASGSKLGTHQELLETGY